MSPPTPGLLLQRLSEEMGTCARLLTAIESEVAMMIQTAPLRSRPAPEALQKIDLLAQTLAELSICLQASARPRFPYRPAPIGQSLRLPRCGWMTCACA